jgi:hypothetical protein
MTSRRPEIEPMPFGRPHGTIINKRMSWHIALGTMSSQIRALK